MSKLGPGAKEDPERPVEEPEVVPEPEETPDEESETFEVFDEEED